MDFDMGTFSSRSNAIPKIDPDRIGYLGESLGSIEGEVACAIEPNIKAWFFSVGGGGIKVATVADPFGNHVGVIENPQFDPAAVR